MVAREYHLNLVVSEKNDKDKGIERLYAYICAKLRHPNEIKRKGVARSLQTVERNHYKSNHRIVRGGGGIAADDDIYVDDYYDDGDDTSSDSDDEFLL